MDKDGFAKWVKQCQEYAVELKLMEGVDYLSLSLYGNWSSDGGRDTRTSNSKRMTRKILRFSLKELHSYPSCRVRK